MGFRVGGGSKGCFILGLYIDLIMTRITKTFCFVCPN